MWNMPVSQFLQISISIFYIWISVHPFLASKRSSVKLPSWEDVWKNWSCLRSLLALPSLRISAKVLTYMIASTLGLSGSQEGKRLLFAPPSSWYLNSSGRVASLWSPDRTHPQRQHQCALFNTFEFGTLEAIMILQVVDWKGYFLRILSTNPLPWSSLPFLYHKLNIDIFSIAKGFFDLQTFCPKDGGSLVVLLPNNTSQSTRPPTDRCKRTSAEIWCLDLKYQGVVKLGEAKMIDRMTF